MHTSKCPKGGSSLICIKNHSLMNEWYLRDCCRKIKAAWRTKGMEGKPITNNPTYGYVKSPEDKDVWLIDEEAAAVVRHIFDMAAEGIGPFENNPKEKIAVFQNTHEAIVDRKTWYMVQELRKTVRRQRNNLAQKRHRAKYAEQVKALRRRKEEEAKEAELAGAEKVAEAILEKNDPRQAAAAVVKEGRKIIIPGNFPTKEELKEIYGDLLTSEEGIESFLKEADPPGLPEADFNGIINSVEIDTEAPLDD